MAEPTLDALSWAAEKRGRLSFADRLAIAVSKEYNYTCVSNDTQLRLECERQDVTVMWGLELLVQLVHARGITATKAETIARAICASNRWLARRCSRIFSSVLGSWVTRISRAISDPLIQSFAQWWRRLFALPRVADQPCGSLGKLSLPRDCC